METKQSLMQLDHLRRKLATEVAPSQSLYEDRESNLLDLSIGLADSRNEYLKDKLGLDNEYQHIYNAYKLSKEKCSNVEAEKHADFELLEKFQQLKLQEIELQTQQKKYDAYRRFSESILKLHMIRESQDIKRINMLWRDNINDIPF